MVNKENDNIEEAGLVAAIEQAADAVIITDTGGRIRYVNLAFTSLTGFSSEEVTLVQDSK